MNLIRSATVIQWLLTSPEPWTRYRTRIDLLDQPEDDPLVLIERANLLEDPKVQTLIAGAATLGEQPFKRHNDTSYPLYQLSTLIDFGLRASHPGMSEVIKRIFEHQSAQGALQSKVNISKAFGGSGEDVWTWMACDAPTLLDCLLRLGLGADERVQAAVKHLVNLGDVNGYRCRVDPALSKFRGPGAKNDPCPIANVLALKALALVPDRMDSATVQIAVEMLLQHWTAPYGQKYYLFGIGSDFRKLKYPFVWYDILHVTDVLSRYPFVWSDPRFQSMLTHILKQSNADGLYTAASMYQSWKGWSFADKKQPSPWITYLVLRIQNRAPQ